MSSTFQTVLLGIFGAALVVGVLIFAGIIPLGKKEAPGSLGTVVVWGTLKNADIGELIAEVNDRNKSVKITYLQKNPSTLDRELVEALAAGTGPDVFFLPTELIVRHASKIYQIPYQNYPIKTFRDSFIEEAELYLGLEGVLGLPVTIDPMVMYYNRDIFQTAGIAKPPVFWEELYEIVPKLVEKDKALNITQSAVALGEFDNITNAKEIFSALVLQLGNKIVTKDPEGKLFSVFDEGVTAGKPASSEALSFYTIFSNPTSEYYTWNKGLPDSRDAFIAGKLGIYFGFSSELFNIQDRNPNLNFDVAAIPQPKDVSKKSTFGKMYALAIAKNSRNLTGAISAVFSLSTPDVISKISQISALPPPRRDLLSVRPGGIYLPIFYNSALFSQSWLDPDPEKTSVILGRMVSDVTSGREDAPSATSRAGREISILLQGKKL
jgi:multiple sugar transport system substrate-binding protein